MVSAGSSAHVPHVYRLQNLILVAESIEVKLYLGYGAEGDESHAADKRTVRRTIKFQHLNQLRNKLLHSLVVSLFQTSGCVQ